MKICQKKTNPVVSRLILQKNFFGNTKNIALVQQKWKINQTNGEIKKNSHKWFFFSIFFLFSVADFSQKKISFKNISARLLIIEK